MRKNEKRLIDVGLGSNNRSGYLALTRNDGKTDNAIANSAKLETAGIKSSIDSCYYALIGDSIKTDNAVTNVHKSTNHEKQKTSGSGFKAVG